MRIKIGKYWASPGKWNVHWGVGPNIWCIHFTHYGHKTKWTFPTPREFIEFIRAPSACSITLGPWWMYKNQ